MRVWILGAALLGAALPVRAQEPPLASVEARAFGGREGATYYAATLERGGWFVKGVGARKGASVRSGQATILHGGSDFEIGGRLKPYRGIEPQLGAAMPDTGARRQRGAVTVRLRREAGGLSVEPRAVLGRDALVGVALGAKKSLGKLALSGAIIPILSGRNGVNRITGGANRTTLWEVSATKGDITLGATNALGPTTGMSLSPSAGSTASLMVKVRVRL